MPADRVLPFYVVCDQSISMMDHVDALYDGLKHLLASCRDPEVAERTRFCLVGFSESPEILLPLRRLTEITELPGPAPRAMTNYGATFTFLRETIARDVRELEAGSLRAGRPVVFFLSDGQPTDPVTWPAAFAALLDPSWVACPHLIAFGVGDADPATMARIGTFRAFAERAGVGPVAAVHAFTGVVRLSILRTGPDDVGPYVPCDVPGFTPLGPL